MRATSRARFRATVVALLLSQPLAGAATADGGSEGARTVVLAVSPSYPPMAVAARITGDVTVAARVAPNGSVTVLTQKPEMPMLKRSVQQAVSRWRFVAADASTDLTVTVVFRVHTGSCEEVLADREQGTYAVFKPPHGVEVWGTVYPECDPVIRKVVP
jgi:TonB family protein